MRFGQIFHRAPSLVVVSPATKSILQRRVAITDGIDQNRNTAGTFSRQTSEINLFYPFVVSSILWDIRVTGTYSCDFLTTVNGSTSEFNVVTGTFLSSGADIVLTPSGGDFLLLPGVHYLSLSSSAAVLWSDKNAAYSYATTFMLNRIYYDGSAYSYTIPIKLVGWYLSAVSSLVNYQRF